MGLGRNLAPSGGESSPVRVLGRSCWTLYAWRYKSPGGGCPRSGGQPPEPPRPRDEAQSGPQPEGDCQTTTALRRAKQPGAPGEQARQREERPEGEDGRWEF